MMNQIQKQMVERNQIKNIGQIFEIGDEMGVELQKVRRWEKVCGMCFCYHGGEC